MMRSFLGLLLLGLPTVASAVPFTFTNQGHLKSPAGVPLTGPHNLTFAFYDAPTNGNLEWTETIGATFTNGSYSVVLGNGVQPLTEDLLDQDLYVGLSVDGGAELTPRHALTAVPYAMLAETATNVDGGTVDATRVTVGNSQLNTDSIVVNGDTIDGARINEWDSVFDAVNAEDSDPSDWDFVYDYVMANAGDWDDGFSYFSAGDPPGLGAISQTAINDWNTDAVNDADADPNNEIQTLSRSGNSIVISGGNSASINDDDADSNNELQSLSLDGGTLSITNGNSVSLGRVGTVAHFAASSPGQTTESILVDGAGGATAEVADQCWTPEYTAGPNEVALIHASIMFDAGSVRTAAPLAAYSDNDLLTVRGNGNGSYHQAQYFSPTVFGSVPLDEGETYRFGMIVDDGPENFSAACQTLVQIIRQ